MPVYIASMSSGNHRDRTWLSSCMEVNLYCSVIGSSGDCLSVLGETLGPSSTIALQTNGTLLSEEVLDLVAETKTRLSISIDGPQAVNDRFRVDHRGNSTFYTVMDAIERARSHPDSDAFFYGVLAVIDPESDPADVYRFFKSTDVDSVDFLYKDGNHDRLPQENHESIPSSTVIG